MPQREARSSSSARSRPSSSKPTSQDATKSCRLPVKRMSSSRSRRSFTGRPVRWASSAATQATGAAWVSLPPNPPPTLRTSVTTALCGTPSTLATSCWTSVGCWVEECTSIPPPSRGMAIGHLALQVEVLLAADGEPAGEPPRRAAQRRPGVARAA